MNGCRNGFAHVRTAVSASVPLALGGCSFQPLPPGATEQAASAHAMWVLFGWTGFGVAVLVFGLIFWCIVRYRRRDGDASFPVQFRRNNRLEIVYTVVPLLLVGVLFAYTYAAEWRIEAIAPRRDVVVDVSGFRWSWQFRYPELGITVDGTRDHPPELVLPVAKIARLNVTSLDVDHSFWIPAFLFKRDAIPGLRNVFDLTPTTLGTFRGECGEYCGLDHALMSFSVRVVSQADFERWARARHGPTAFANGRPR